MMRRHDPLADPAPLIRRVYSYVAYRLGDGPDAEDVTHDVFERALRYRATYDETRGQPLPWLLGIARRCVDDARRAPRPVPAGVEPVEVASREDLGSDVVQRLTIAGALDGLDDRARDLLALRYGADLTARQIGEVLGLKANAVEVALHRALARLRGDLEDDAPSTAAAQRRDRDPATGTSS
jgi:RNA polymerase sigma-70 factor (ECF subfamily)